MPYAIWRMLTKRFSRLRGDWHNGTRPLGVDCEEVLLVTDTKLDANMALNARADKAPIASIEQEADEACEDDDIEKPDNAGRSRKSRVRTYLKRCKARLTGLPLTQPPVTAELDSNSNALAVPPAVDALKAVAIHDRQPLADIAVEGHVGQLLACAADAQESGLAALIDRHLSSIYPVYFERTRAILIRQARDLLLCSYRGCLQTFERQFLNKFTEIATQLRRKHMIGESLLWHPGWPLATPIGELILHLGALDEALLRPSEIYLCVKAVDSRDIPRFYVVWRSAQAGNPVRSRCCDCSDPAAFLSPLALEMLSDELPQLLQSLLVSVERTIDRASLNELELPLPQQQQSANDANSNIISNCSSLSRSNIASSSPKCPLRRSELITKNKMMSSKYMLRRLTNRQDSMNSTSSGNSCASSGSASSDELLCYNNINNNERSAQPVPPTSPALPLFCLGNSFPHIDSDEENADEKRCSMEADQLETEILPPTSITEIPDKLLTSGIYLPGTRNLSGNPIITVDAEKVAASGLNCYEIATVLLFYSTIPESVHANGNLSSADLPHHQSAQPLLDTPMEPKSATSNQPAQQTFAILITIEKSQHLSVVELICQSLRLLTQQIAHCEILGVCLERKLLHLCNSNWPATAEVATEACDNHQKLPRLPQYAIKFIIVDELTKNIAAAAIPHSKLGGLHHHDAWKWREFFMQLEPFQQQCVTAGQRLVAAMGDIRAADLQGLPTRRQLYSQHRALSRALMNAELHTLRKRGGTTLKCLQDLVKSLNLSHSDNYNNRNSGNNLNDSKIPTSMRSNTYSFRHNSPTINVNVGPLSAGVSSAAATAGDNNNGDNRSGSGGGNIDVAVRLHKVTLLYNEVDRAAKRLEELTEQRRERLRELTRQRALEDEMDEVTSWISNDGNEMLQRFISLQLNCDTAIKEHEHEFEKYYFISMKHLAKGRDLCDAAVNMDSLRENAVNLKSALECFSEKLEQARERIEGLLRLHHLLNLQTRNEALEQEMQHLADELGVQGLLEKHQQLQQPNQQKQDDEKIKPNYARNVNKPAPSTLISSTPIPTQKPNRSSHRSSSGNGSMDEHSNCHCWRELRNLEDMDALMDGDADEEDCEEEHSKIADSGLGGCERCEGNPKLTRVCSCQSLNEGANLYDKSHNSDELDDECYDRPLKRYHDIRSPMEANAHLQCHAFNFELPKLEELQFLDPKIQKTLLLIMREMIATERDYVRSLYYVIENYVDELLRDDIPQPLRGQRNVIFGNIEKIFEFHNSHFLSELERYECNPLKVGAAFLQMESKFYLYALYNKNKPKSDTLMSEYGTAFFKSKQFELNDKMDLASYLLKPVQRMGKYALLLQQLVKICSSVESAALQEIAADVEELQRAEEMVKFQLRHGNDLLAMDSLRDCDVNVKEQGRLLRQNEFLVWQGRGGKKTLRQIFLFEELVLFSKARRFPDHKNLDIYIYKNSIKTSDIGLTAHVGDSPTKFEIWFRKRKPDDTWTLQCMSEDIKNAWTEEISKLLWKQAKRNREIRLAEMSSMGIGSKPCLDIRPSNNQISDRSIAITHLGKAPKLRHSFVGLQAEQNKSTRRPDSLISESSVSSGTTSSSLSGGSSSGHERKADSGTQALELINETQALKLAFTHGHKPHCAKTNTLSSGSSGASGNLRNSHKRSTTLVSQLSMESGILSDISMTPDQEQQPDGPSWATAAASSAPAVSKKRLQKANSYKEEHPKTNAETTSEDATIKNPYLQYTEDTVNL